MTIVVDFTAMNTIAMHNQWLCGQFCIVEYSDRITVINLSWIRINLLNFVLKKRELYQYTSPESALLYACTQSVHYMESFCDREFINLQIVQLLSLLCHFIPLHFISIQFGHCKVFLQSWLLYGVGSAFFASCSSKKINHFYLIVIPYLAVTSIFNIAR